MRLPVSWLMTGVLVGLVLADSGEPFAAPTSLDLRNGATGEGRAVPIEGVIEREDRAGEGSVERGAAMRAARVAVEGRVEERIVQTSQALDTEIREIEETAGRMGLELDDVTVTVIEHVGRFAARLMRGTRAEAAEFHHAYKAVATTLTSLSRCLATGMATSPFGPAGPRTASPASEPDGEADPSGAEG
jgi:hypothetical protein